MQRRKGKNRRAALALGSLLTPAAVMAMALGLWRLASDLKIAGDFAIPSGVFSHWQVWMACAVVLQRCAWALNRYGRGSDSAPS